MRRGEWARARRFSLSPERRSFNVCCGRSNGVRSKAAAAPPTKTAGLGIAALLRFHAAAGADREEQMRFEDRGLLALAAFAAIAFILSLTLTIRSAGAQGQDKTYVMKIGTPTVNDTPEEFSRGFAEMVEKESGGRLKVEVYSASKLGSIPREIEGLQFGSIECGIFPPEFYVGIDERFEVLAAPGM